MKKSILTLSAILLALLVVSCSEESIESTESSENLKISLQENTNVGIYKGVFTTLNSEFRGIVEIEVVDFNNTTPAESFHRASITLQNGDVIFATSKDKITSNTTVKQALFKSNEISFSFSVNNDGSNPIVLNALLNNEEADIIVAKHTSRAPVEPITGTYSCFICKDHPILDGTDQTFNIVFVSSPDGNSDITTQVLFNGTTYNGVGVQNNCNANGTTSSCDMESGNGIDNKDGFFIGANAVQWEARHNFNNEVSNPGDCSEVWGAWAIDTDIYGLILGGFKNDPISDCPAVVNNLTENGFDNFTGAGFAPDPNPGQLDSDFIIVNGLSDGDLDYGGTETSGDFARGSNDGGVTTGGVYAFDVDGAGDIALGVQPGGSDFTPGYFEIKIPNNSGNNLTSFVIEYDVLYLNNASRSNSLSFSYSKNGSAYFDLEDLVVVSPEASDANGWIRITRTAEFNTTVSNNQDLYIRFTGDDVSGGGSRDEFAIDNIRLVEAD